MMGKVTIVVKSPIQPHSGRVGGKVEQEDPPAVSHNRNRYLTGQEGAGVLSTGDWGGIPPTRTNTPTARVNTNKPRAASPGWPRGAKKLQNKRPTYESPRTREERRKRGVNKGGAPFASPSTYPTKRCNNYNEAWELFRQRIGQGHYSTFLRNKEKNGDVTRRQSEPLGNVPHSDRPAVQPRLTETTAANSPRVVRFSGDTGEEFAPPGKRSGRRRSVPTRMSEPRQNRSSVLRKENNMKWIKMKEEKKRLANINRHSNTPGKESGKTYRRPNTPQHRLKKREGTDKEETDVNVVNSKTKHIKDQTQNKEQSGHFNSLVENKKGNSLNTFNRTHPTTQQRGGAKNGNNSNNAAAKELHYGKISSWEKSGKSQVVIVSGTTPTKIVNPNRRYSLGKVKTNVPLEPTPDTIMQQQSDGARQQRKHPFRRRSLSESQTIFGRIDTTESLQEMENIRKRRRERRSRSLNDSNTYQSMHAIQKMNEALLFGIIPTSKVPLERDNRQRTSSGRQSKKTSHEKEVDVEFKQHNHGQLGDISKNSAAKPKSMKNRKSVGDFKVMTAPAIIIETNPSVELARFQLELPKKRTKLSVRKTNTK